MHTPESIEKMKLPRPGFSPSPAHHAAISSANSSSNRNYTKEFGDAVSARLGTTIYVYTATGLFVQSFSSIIRAKEAYGITLHHNTIYKRIASKTIMNGYLFSYNAPK